MTHDSFMYHEIQFAKKLFLTIVATMFIEVGVVVSIFCGVFGVQSNDSVASWRELGNKNFVELVLSLP